MEFIDYEIEIGWSARKRLFSQGITDSDIRWAFTNHMGRILLSESPEKYMAAGFDTKGRPLEVGYVNTKKGIRIIHCMKCRKQYEYLLR